jgi:hypothetical protein
MNALGENKKTHLINPPTLRAQKTNTMVSFDLEIINPTITNQMKKVAKVPKGG